MRIYSILILLLLSCGKQEIPVSEFSASKNVINYTPGLVAPNKSAVKLFFPDSMSVCSGVEIADLGVLTAIHCLGKSFTDNIPKSGTGVVRVVFFRESDSACSNYDSSAAKTVKYFAFPYPHAGAMLTDHKADGILILTVYSPYDSGTSMLSVMSAAKGDDNILSGASSNGDTSGNACILRSGYNEFERQTSDPDRILQFVQKEAYSYSGDSGAPQYFKDTAIVPPQAVIGINFMHANYLDPNDKRVVSKSFDVCAPAFRQWLRKLPGLSDFPDCDVTLNVGISQRIRNPTSGEVLSERMIEESESDESARLAPPGRIEISVVPAITYYKLRWKEGRKTYSCSKSAGDTNGRCKGNINPYHNVKLKWIPNDYPDTCLPGGNKDKFVGWEKTSPTDYCPCSGIGECTIDKIAETLSHGKETINCKYVTEPRACNSQ